MLASAAVTPMQGDPGLRRAEEEAELVGPGQAGRGAVGSALVVGAGQHTDLTARAHLVDRGLDRLLRGRGRVATEGVVPVDRVHVAGRRALGLGLEVERRVGSTDAHGQGVGVPVEAEPVAAGLQQQPSVDLGVGERCVDLGPCARGRLPAVPCWERHHLRAAGSRHGGLARPPRAAERRPRLPAGSDRHGAVLIGLEDQAATVGNVGRPVPDVELQRDRKDRAGLIGRVRQ